MDDVKKKQDKLGFLPFIIGGLSFIPLVGILFGAISIIWGLFLKSRSGKILALVGGIGISLSVILYGSIYYLGFHQRGGVYDFLRMKGAQREVTNLVPYIEFYKLQNGIYPPTLTDLSDVWKTQEMPIVVYDPMTMHGTNPQSKQFYYELTKDGKGYYLLGIGVDEIPFTSDDILPKVDTKNIGLLINPASKPTP